MSSAENDTRPGRLVWISDEWIAEARDDWENGSGYPDLSVVIEARDAAPADPAEAVFVAIYGETPSRSDRPMVGHVPYVLAALGVPKETP